MIYLGNGMYSNSGPDLMHGGPWKTHKYIAIKNGRYIYPGDKIGTSRKLAPPPGVNNRDAREQKKKQYAKEQKEKYDNSVTNQGPSQAQRAQEYKEDITYNTNSRNTKKNRSNYSLYKEVANEYYDEEYRRGAVSNPVEKAALVRINALNNVGKDVRKNIGNKIDDAKDAAKEKVQNIKDKARYKDLYGTIKVTEPSKAEWAQRKHNYNHNGYNLGSTGQPPIPSRNVDTRKSDNMKRKYNDSVSSQGPSAAEKAQQNPNGSSRNTYKNKKSVGKITYTRQGPSVAEKAQTYRETEYDVKGTQSRQTNHGASKIYYPKYNDSVTKQGPSAAEKAQRKGGWEGTSRNVHTKYKSKPTTGEKVKGSIKKGVKAVDKGISDGVNALKKAIIGEEGKVVTQKSKKKKKK